MTDQPTLFDETTPSHVEVGANGVALCHLCTASYPADPADVAWVTDVDRWAQWHASLPHNVRSGGLWLVGGAA